MSHYKSAIRAQPPSDQPENNKFHEKARQLQELFPAWSNDDLQSLLSEVNGDVEVAATRISDGRAEQWGSVTRKKEKKPTPAPGHAAKESVSGRGDFRGSRGGRGGRGGLPGRGGGARGRGGPPRGGAANGHVAVVHQGSPTPAGAPTTSTSLATEKHDASPAPSDATPSAWADSSSSLSEAPSASTGISTPGSAWTGASTTSTWGGDTDVNGSVSSVNLSPAPSKPSKIPANSKLSWAQIARPQEKLTPPPPPPSAPVAPPPPPAAPVVPLPSILTNPPSPPAPAPEPEPDTQHLGWEEPTTVQAPSWDDEPPAKQFAESWPPTEAKTESEPPAPVEEPTPAQVPEPVLEKVPEPEPIPSPIPPKAAAAPVRPAPVTHRSSAKYKSDQPVILPSSFGSTVEKVGMQFGSLSLGGESIFDPLTPEHETQPALEPQSPPTPPVQQSTISSEPSAVAAPPPTSASLGSSLYQQQPLSHPTQQSSPQVTIPHTALPTSVSQPAVPTQAAASHVVSSPLQPFTQPHQSAVSQASQAPPQSQPLLHQQPPQSHLPQQLQQQSLHQYSQHGLPTHLEPQQNQSPPQAQPSSAAAHSAYFRQSDASTPYFHAPTPPAQQTQDNYGSFGLVGQAQHQQGSHLGGFGGGDYGYADSQRGFYDSYQQSSFGGRNVLGSHEDIKGLPGTQQQPSSATGGLPPSNAQTSQQHPSSQGAGQPQNQGPYPPPPVPYYFNPYTQNQYYGTPYNNAYGVPQPFVKYPAMYQPPGPGSAPSPVTKQPGPGGNVSVQPQSNPYGQTLYQQTAGYDDYSHQQHSLGGDYGKQLYGGGAGQGFMGSGAGGASGRGAGSPETAYKPYAPKDVGVGVGSARGGVQQQQQQAQQQGQGQGQAGQGGPQGQGFYGGARFGAGVGSGVGGPQQSAHHQQGGPQGHLYPQQGQNDAGFYYQGQGRYWQ
ncbi:hypothetical protein IW262DRAFT_1397768 [Armillaria fumosa]|nr:hypothetical protein IW262DRAFT_1397768 [Armillaria fumosa]